MMKRKNSILVICILCLMSLSTATAQKKAPVQKMAPRWSEARVNAWYDKQPWLAGCNYIPASAINQIEMWSKDTYDAPQINKELGWAEGIGFNTLRVFLSSVVWKNDPQGMKNRMNDFLNICKQHGIRPFFVFFDDCWNDESHYGKQPDPKPGVHNSGWIKDPSISLRKDTAALYASLGKYVKDILTTFGKDSRVLMWDLYNEPSNSGQGLKSLPLLRKVFQWARECNPTQPLTSGLWDQDNRHNNPIHAFQLNNSDVISYHNYGDEKTHASEITYLKTLNRPLVCTEYMARRNNSTFQTIMPMLKKEKVVAINWGFVSGKTNTIFAWDTPLPDQKEPKLWFHDIFRQDGTPFDQKEVDCIRSLTGK